MHPTRNLFAEYKNEWFVETGTFRGDAVIRAIEAGFTNIISIDNDPKARELCGKRFTPQNLQNINQMMIATGDSAECLWGFIENIKTRITFWLDAHWLLFEDTDPGPNPFPLLQEIEQIGRHPIKDHVLIIDDMRLMQWDIVGYDKGLIQTRIEQINANYKFKMFANPMINDIMVAYVE